MAKQLINLGSSENRGDGDPLRTAFTKINNNFDEVYNDISNIVTFSGSYNDLTDTPTLFDGSYNSLTDTPDLSQYISRTEFDNGTITIDVNNTGDLVGSVFADDSTLLVDAVNGVIPYSVLDGAPTALSNFSNDLDYTAIVGGAIQTNGLPIGTEASGLFAKNGQSLALGYKDSNGTAWSHISLSESNNIQIQANVTVAAATTFNFNGATISGTNFLTSEQHGNFTLSNNTITTNNGDTGIDLVINGATSDDPPALVNRAWRFVNDGSLEFRNPFDFGSEVKATITSTKVSNWDTAHGWGDHSSAGYISGISVTTDSTNFEYNLVFVPSAGNKSSVRIDGGSNITYNPSTNTLTLNSETVTSTKISNWDTAYGWGDHSSAGYLTSVSGFITDNADDTMSGKLTISNSGTIGATTPANGYLKITDSTNTLALDPNEIYSTSNLAITTVTGTSINGTVTVDDLVIREGVQERYAAKTSATGTVAHDCSTGHIFNHSSISANFTANFTNLTLSTGYATTVTLILNQGGTAYMAIGLEIDGSSQTINWQDGSQPNGTANGIDVVTFSILNASGTYTVLGSSVGYS